MENTMKKLFMMIALLGAMALVTSCRNTADGVVEDVEKAVDDVKDATN
jgi:predicted small secreted protein